MLVSADNHRGKSVQAHVSPEVCHILRNQGLLKSVLSTEPDGFAVRATYSDILKRLGMFHADRVLMPIE